MKARNKLTLILLIVVLVFLVFYSTEVFADHYNYVVMGSSTSSPRVEEPFTIFVAADVSNGTNYWVAFSDWDNKNNPGWQFQFCGKQRFCEKSWTVIPKSINPKRYYGEAANATSWQLAQQSPLIISATAIKPSSTISADKTSVVIGGTVTITISATDDYGIKYISFWDPAVGSWVREDCPGSPKSCTKSRSFSLPFAGTADYYGGAGDIHDAWEWSSPKPLSVAVTQADTTPPTGSIAASPSSVVSGETITVTMNGSDNIGVDRLFWNEGSQTHSCGGVSPCSHSWSTTILTPGNYTFSGRVYDAANNSTRVTSNTVTVTQSDTTPPTGSITASPSAATPGQTITIEMSGSDNVGVDWLLWNDAHSGGSQWHWCGGALKCSKSWFFSPSTSGNYTFAGAVYDRNNNVTGVTSNTVTVSNAPAFSLSPNDFSYTYPNVNAREFSDRTYTVTNTGGGFLNGGISVSGVGFFCINFCSNYSLSAGQSRSYTVRFSPGSGGAFSGSAAFTSAPGRTVSLSGTGVVVDTTLTFPSDTWHRLWYSTSGSSPNVSLNAFLGEGSGSNDKNGNPPNITSASFDTDWGDRQLYNTTASGTDNGKDKIGFKSGRSFTVGTPGVYNFIIGSDDGARLEIGGAQVANQWTEGGFRRTTGSVTLNVAGTYNSLFEYYENGGGARVLFTPAVSIGAVPSTINQGQSFTLAAYCAGCDGKTANFWWSLLDDRGRTPLTSCIISGGSCARTVTAPHGSDFKVWALVDISGDGDTNDDGETSPTTTVNVVGCDKSGLLYSDTFVTVKTATGTKQSPIRITHFGADSDTNPPGSGVIYEFLNSAPQGATIQMDDKPLGQGDCDNDLTWNTFWGDPLETGYNFFTTVRKQSVDYTGSHTLSYGFKILTDTPTGRTAVIKDATAIECAVSGTLCPIPSISEDRLFTISGPIDQNGTTGATAFGRKLNIVECTTNAHCQVGGNSDANANTATCNLTDTSIPLNTCIEADTIPPLSKITYVGPTYGGVLGTRPQQSDEQSGTVSVFLNAYDQGNTAKPYTISVQDSDNINTSSQLSCHYKIVETNEAGTVTWDSPDFSRPCSDTFSFPVGTIGAGGYCAEQGNDTCRLRVWAVDRAGNTNSATERRIGQAILGSSVDEQRYNDFTAFPNGFNTFWFGVDWTPPSAQ